MGGRRSVCITLVGELPHDSRCLRFASALALDHDVTVLALADAADSLRVGDVTVMQFARGNPSSLRASLWRFWDEGGAAAADLRADVYIASDLYSLPAAGAAATRTRAPLIYDSRELYPNIASLQGHPIVRAYWRNTERRHASKASSITTVNQSIAEILRGRYPGKRVEVLHNYPESAAPERTSRLRDALGIPGELTILLSQGGLQKGRGAFLYVDGMAELPGCALVFLGSGPLANDVLDRARRLGVGDRVFVHPSVPSRELLSWTASADIGLCMIENLGQSYFLSLPNKLFEYIAAGLPVVGSDFPEIARVIAGDGVGRVAAPDDASAFVRAARELTDDAAAREACVTHCESARQRYAWSSEAERLRALVDNAVTDGGRV
ncbi:MAG: glycosyltransferase [Ignavibacteria bacterium]|nr:glycosyltransferase [Ignavibacteria bacterium]